MLPLICVHTLYCAVNGLLLVPYSFVAYSQQPDEELTSARNTLHAPQPQTLGKSQHASWTQGHIKQAFVFFQKTERTHNSKRTCLTFTFVNGGCQHSLKNDLTRYYIFAVIWVYFFYLCGKISPFSECQHGSLLCGCFGASVLHLYALECLNDSSNHHNYHPWLTHQFTVTSWKASTGRDIHHNIWLYKMYTSL